MPESLFSSPISALGSDARRLASDAAEMLDARRKLAELEIRSDIASSKRLAIAGGAGLVLALTGLPVLAVLLAGGLGARFPLSGDGPPPSAVNWWLLVLGVLFVVAGTLTVVWAWRRFRRDLLGLQESLGELKEDMAWLKEWAAGAD